MQREAEFHDTKYSGGDSYPRHYASWPTQYVYTEMRDALGESPASACSNTAAARAGSPATSQPRRQRLRLRHLAPGRREHPQVLAAAKLLERCTVGVMPAEKL